MVAVGGVGGYLWLTKPAKLSWLSYLKKQVQELWGLWSLGICECCGRT